MGKGTKKNTKKKMKDNNGIKTDRRLGDLYHINRGQSSRKHQRNGLQGTDDLMKGNKAYEEYLRSLKL